MPAPLLDFDPYALWLGIQERERPLNPYQILNLITFDADRSRVRLALERQLTVLEGKRSTADPEAWQSVHDELQSAAEQLLDPEQRAVIDAGIKRKMAQISPRKPASGTAVRLGGALLACPSCHHENAANRRFCGGCGEGLWETCPQCGGELPAAERFCGQCGTDVRDILSAQVQQVEERLNAAETLLAEHRYDAALSALRGVAASDNPKLEKFAARALLRIEQVEAQREKALAEAGEAQQRASRLMANKEFEAAAAELDKIPLPLRDAEAQSLLESARFAEKEFAGLLSEIREALQQKQRWELFGKIDRALSLKPDHAGVRDLAEKLRDQFVASARKRLEEKRYEDAVQMLKQIPEALRTDEARNLLDVGSELAELMSDVKRATCASPQSLGLAQLLVKRAPANEEAAKLCQQMQDRCATRPSNQRLARPPWAVAPQRSVLGPPVDWLGHFHRAAPATPQIAQTLAEHPGEFFVALGLALQGLGEETIDINLMPPEKGNVLVKLATMPLLRRGNTTAWGIDVGGNAVRAMQLSKESGDKVKILSCELILLQKPLSHPDAEGQGPALLAAALADLAGRADFKGSRVAAGLSPLRVLGRFFDLPPLPAKKVAGAIEYEARHQIPIDLAELCWDWTAFGRQGDKHAGQVRPIMVVAARQAQVEERLALFKGAGIPVEIMQCESVALHNAIRYEWQDEPAASQSAIALVDIGSDETSFVVSAAERMWFRSFGIGGSSFTSSLVQQLQLTFDQAESVKRHPAKARRYHLFRRAIEPLLVQFTSEVERSLASYSRLESHVPVRQVFTIGGGAQLHGLLRHLRQRS